MSLALADIKLGDPAFWRREDRDEAFALLRRERPISWHEVPASEWHDASAGFWALTRHADVVAVSRDNETFISGEGTEVIDQTPEVARGAGMLNMDAPEHRRLRSIVSRAFTPHAVRQLQGHIHARASEIVERLRAIGECDLVTELVDLYPTRIIGDLVGAPESDLPELVRLTKVILGPTVEESRAANLAMIEYGRELARARTTRPREDVLSTIVHARVEGEQLTEREAGVFFALLMTAGIETTGTATAHGVIALARRPDEHTRLAADYERLGRTAIEEILRWASPVIRFRRTCVRDTEIGGQPIAAGEKVVLWYPSANRDESVFDEPFRFDIERDPNPHVAFGGGGPHFCLGAGLARSELTTLFEQLVTRLPCPELTATPVPAHNDAFNAIVSLPVSFASTSARV